MMKKALTWPIIANFIAQSFTFPFIQFKIEELTKKRAKEEAFESTIEKIANLEDAMARNNNDKFKVLANELDIWHYKYLTGVVDNIDVYMGTVPAEKTIQNFMFDFIENCLRIRYSIEGSRKKEYLPKTHPFDFIRVEKPFYPDYSEIFRQARKQVPITFEYVNRKGAEGTGIYSMKQMHNWGDDFVKVILKDKWGKYDFKFSYDLENPRTDYIGKQLKIITDIAGSINDFEHAKSLGNKTKETVYVDEKDAGWLLKHIKEEKTNFFTEYEIENKIILPVELRNNILLDIMDFVESHYKSCVVENVPMVYGLTQFESVAMLWSYQNDILPRNLRNLIQTKAEERKNILIYADMIAAKTLNIIKDAYQNGINEIIVGDRGNRAAGIVLKEEIEKLGLGIKVSFMKFTNHEKISEAYANTHQAKHNKSIECSVNSHIKQLKELKKEYDALRKHDVVDEGLISNIHDKKSELKKFYDDTKKISKDIYAKGFKKHCKLEGNIALYDDWVRTGSTKNDTINSLDSLGAQIKAFYVAMKNPEDDADSFLFLNDSSNFEKDRCSWQKPMEYFNNALDGLVQYGIDKDAKDARRLFSRKEYSIEDDIIKEGLKAKKILLDAAKKIVGDLGHDSIRGFLDEEKNEVFDYVSCFNISSQDMVPQIHRP